MSLDLEAIAAAAREHLTASRFPDMVLSKIRLQRLLGVGVPHHLDEQERIWLEHKAHADAVFDGPKLPAYVPPAPVEAAKPKARAKPEPMGSLL
jgi:hypothetical protein